MVAGHFAALNTSDLNHFLSSAGLCMGWITADHELGGDIATLCCGCCCCCCLRPSSATVAVPVVDVGNAFRDFQKQQQKLMRNIASSLERVYRYIFKTSFQIGGQPRDESGHHQVG
jgi:hypothetical protein